MPISRRDLLRYGTLGTLSLPWFPALSRAVPVEEKSELPDLGHLTLNRAAYGPTPALTEMFMKTPGKAEKQLKNFVEAQLHPQQIDDHVVDQKLKELGLVTLQKNLTTAWHDHSLAVKEMKQDPNVAKVDENKIRQQPVVETETATWIRAVYSQRQLFEVVTEFWHDHFNVQAFEGNVAPVFGHFDREVIRKNAFGNFRAMLQAVATSPAMLFYLDNFVNQSSNPNENYARELFELHTLGAENYLGTQDRRKVLGFAQGHPVGYVDGDVYEAARCFTGWGVDTGKNSKETGTFAYEDSHHDRFQKIVLGRPFNEMAPPMKDGERVLDLLSEHPGTAQFIAKKLCRRLVADEPPGKLVKAAAKVFHEQRKAHDQVAQVIRFILLSPEFAGTWGQRMKRPFDATASLLRMTQADFTPSEKFINNYNRAGQRRFQWRTPDGYPDSKEKWATTTGWFERWRFANMLLNNRIDGVKVDLTTPLFKQNLHTPEAIATYWTRELLPTPVHSQVYREVVDLLAMGRRSDRDLASDQVEKRVAHGVALIAMSPQFQWR